MKNDDQNNNKQIKEQAEEFFNSAVEKKQLGYLEEAIADYTKAIELDPEYVWAYNNRGFAKKNLGQYQEAIADFTKAIKIYQ